MKKRTKRVYFRAAIFMLVGTLVGCAGNKDEKSIEEATSEANRNSSIEEATGKTDGGSAIKEATSKTDESLSRKEATSKTDKSSSSTELKQSDTADKGDISSEKSVDENSNSKVSKKEDKKTLSDYSSKQIEYARIWLQLGPNQEIDELNVRHISAGEPVNIYDDTSANYPKDVVTLEGSRSVDGSVTYSSNGNGTINVYNVPSHWSSSAQVDKDFMKNYTEDIIQNAKLVHVDPGEDKKIIELINILNVH
ncbi:hypothetical protein [Priestia megaterium]|uniref:hypothetical protein n=1 Tax=Priestia megaterium TaxID=1404 RepID=UPI000CA35A2E|nr:hypothetical protein [Priestia megaterium]AUO09771.1 hypothetical protein C0569_00300 [Priestia megaterium]